MKGIYIFAIILLALILITYISLRLINSDKNSRNKPSIIKETSAELLSFDKFQYDIKENISSITTVPSSSRYYYMGSDNLLKDGLNYAWYPTKTQDNKYIINIQFKKQVILKTLRIYTGLSDNNNKFTGLIIKDEVGEPIYNNQNINILPHKINNYFEVSINDIFTTKFSLEFTAPGDFIVRKVMIFGSVKMKSRAENLVGKNIVPITDPMTDPALEYSLINGVQVCRGYSCSLQYDANRIHQYVRVQYNSQTRKVILRYKFNKIYSFYGLEITQLISGFNKYGYGKLKVYTDKLPGGEEYDTKYMTKIFSDDTNSTDNLNLKVFSTPEIYNYMVYFDPVTDNNLILEFSDVIIDEFKPARLKFYGYDIIFGYYDTFILSNYTKERISLAEIQLIDNNDVNILPSLVNQNKVTIFQSPDSMNTMIKMIKIEKEPYDGPVYSITSNETMNNYLYGVNEAGGYALDIGYINIYDKNGLIDKSKFDVYVSSFFRIKNKDSSITDYTLSTQVDPSVSVGNPDAPIKNYISNPSDKKPSVMILFKDPVDITKVIIRPNLRSESPNIPWINKTKVTWYNRNNDPIVSTYNLTQQTILKENLRFSNDSISNKDVYYTYDNDVTTFNRTAPDFSLITNPKVKGPTIFINITEPVILKAMRIINKKESNVLSNEILGLNIVAYLSGKWAKPNNVETPFKCTESWEATKYAPGGQVLERKYYYNAYRLKNNGNSECLSKDGNSCDSFSTMDSCNDRLRYISGYKNRECGTGTKENPGRDCKYYQKTHMIIKDCVDGDNGYNKVGFRVTPDNNEVLFCERDDSNNCKNYDKISTCLNEEFKQDKTICTTPSETNNVDTICSKAKFKLLSNKYNSVYKVFEVPEIEPKENYYFPLGIPITDQSLIMEKNNNVLCLDEYNSSNDEKNNVKIMNCTNDYSQVVRIKNYRTNPDDSVGINKVYNSILDKCLTYMSDNKLIFRNCDNDLDTIQEFNITEDGKLKHSSGKCLNVDNFENKNAVLTSCEDAPKVKISNFFSNECSSFTCPDTITHYSEYRDFDIAARTSRIVKAYLFSLMVDTNGQLIFITRDFFSKKVISNINLLTTFPSKWNIVSNEKFSYPYNMKIINEGILTCYDNNNKVVWRSKEKDSSYNPPYTLRFLENYDRVNKTISVKIQILNGKGDIINTIN